jgi:hypothetical protein
MYMYVCSYICVCIPVNIVYVLVCAPSPLFTTPPSLLGSPPSLHVISYPRMHARTSVQVDSALQPLFQLEVDNALNSPQLRAHELPRLLQLGNRPDPVVNPDIATNYGASTTMRKMLQKLQIEVSLVIAEDVLVCTFVFLVHTYVYRYVNLSGICHVCDIGS